MYPKKRFDQNLLIIFTEVYKARSYTRAAEKLDMTQPAVSNAMNRLKQHVNEELFIRDGRGIQPTNLANTLFHEIDPSLNQLDTIISGFDKFDTRFSQRNFHVYGHDMIIYKIQRNIDKELENLSVNITFHETSMDEDKLENYLLGEKANLIIDISRDLETPYINSKKVLTDTVVCIARKSHPRIKGHIDSKQFFEEKHATHKLKRTNLSIFDLYSKKSMPRRIIHTEHSSLTSMLITIGQTDAIGITLKSFAHEYAEKFDLQVLECPLSVNPIEFHMLWPKRLDNNSANKWLRGIIEKGLESQPV